LWAPANGVFAKKLKWDAHQDQMGHVVCFPSITEHLAFVSEAVSFGKIAKSSDFVFLMQVAWGLCVCGFGIQHSCCMDWNSMTCSVGKLWSWKNGQN